MKRGEVGRDFAWGVAGAALVWLALQAAGGIWSHVGGRDLHGFFLPRFEEAARRLILEGQLPLWGPHEFTGSPRFAALQGQVLYLPTPLLFAMLPRFVALQALYAVNLFILAWGTVVYLGRHRVARPFALLAVLVAAFGCFSGWSRAGMDHPNFLASIAWVPWIAFAWENAVERGASPWLGWMALAVLAQWLAGYPEFPMATAVLLGAMGLASGPGRLIHRLTVLGSGFMLGTLLSAVQLLPLAEAVRESHRVTMGGGYASLRELYGLVSAGLLGPLFYERFSPAILLLGAAAFLVRERIYFVWLAALIWSVFAMDPPFSWIYWMPPFSGLRYATGWVHLTGVFLGWLAAAGIGALISFRGMRPVVGRVVAYGLALAAAISCLAGIFEAPRDMPNRLPDYPLLEERAGRLASEMARIDPMARLASRREIDSGSTVRFGLDTPEGYDPTMPPRRIRRLLDQIASQDGGAGGRMLEFESDPRLSELLGVGFVAVYKDRAARVQGMGFERVAELPGDDVLLYRPPVPRARLVHQLVVARDEDAAFERTVDPGRDLRQTAVVEVAGIPVEQIPSGAKENVSIASERPEEVRLEVEAAAPGVVVLADTWFPGWEATLDGEPTEILRADHAFRAVAVSAGRHQIVFRYRPLSLRVGFLVSALALLATLLLILVPALSRLRRKTVCDAGAIA